MGVVKGWTPTNTTNDGHQGGRYASFWNAFFFYSENIMKSSSISFSYEGESCFWCCLFFSLPTFLLKYEFLPLSIYLQALVWNLNLSKKLDHELKRTLDLPLELNWMKAFILCLHQISQWFSFYGIPTPSISGSCNLCKSMVTLENQSQTHSQLSPLTCIGRWHFVWVYP